MNVVVLGQDGLGPFPLDHLLPEPAEIFVRMHLDHDVHARKLPRRPTHGSNERFPLRRREKQRDVLRHEDDQRAAGRETKIASDLLAQVRRRHQPRGIRARVANHRHAPGLDALLVDQALTQVLADDNNPIADIEGIDPVSAEDEGAGAEYRRDAAGPSHERRSALGIAPVAGNEDSVRSQDVEGPESRFLVQQRCEQTLLDGRAQEGAQHGQERDAVPVEPRGQVRVAVNAPPYPPQDRPVAAHEGRPLLARQVVHGKAGGHTRAEQAIDARIELRILVGAGDDARFRPGRPHGFDERIDDEVVPGATGDEEETAAFPGRQRRGIAAGLVEQSAEAQALLAREERGIGAREHVRKQADPRDAYRDVASAREQSGQPLGH